MTQTPQNLGNIVSGLNSGHIASKNLAASGSADNNNHQKQMVNQNLLNYQTKEKTATLHKNTANTSS